MNTPEGTVKGQLEGGQNELNEMYTNTVNFSIYCNKILYFLRKHWLQNKGSPSSSIDKAVFSEMKPLDDYTFKSFNIKR